MTIRVPGRGQYPGFNQKKEGLIHLGFEERLESMSDALFHIKQLASDLKRLGNNYLNHIDILDDIRQQVEIDEAVTEQKLNEQCEREQLVMLREYYQST